MPKVNTQNLDGQIQEIVVKQLIYAITFLESPKQTAAFFSDFLTDAETVMLSKRLAIAILLMRGHSQTLITKMLSVSYPATGAVASWLKNADPATTIVLNTIAQDDDWKEIVYNFKSTNGKRSQRSSEGLKRAIDTHPEFEPASIDAALKDGDFNHLDGPELVASSPTEVVQNQSKSPSMSDLLEEV